LAWRKKRVWSREEPPPSIMIYLVTYSLKQEPNHFDYHKFYDYIESHDGAFLSDSAYIITSEQTPEEIYDAVSHFIDPEDWVLIAALTKPCAGSHSTEVTDWLAKNL